MATNQSAKDDGLFQLSSSSDRTYTQVNLNEWLKNLKSNGILLRNESLTTQLECSPSSGTMNTVFDEGEATIEGHQLIFTSTETATPLTHTTADVTNPRIDLIILEKNTDVGTRSDSIKILTGTPAASPSEPTLTQSATIWQEKLYAVLIPANETDADNFTYTDNRENVIAEDITTVASATETIEGKIRKATTVEAEAGTSDVGAMTPEKTKEFHDKIDDYSCHLIMAADQTSGDKIVWGGTPVYDTNTMRNAANNERIDIKATGKYLIDFWAFYNATNTNTKTFLICQIYKNGSELGIGMVHKEIPPLDYDQGPVLFTAEIKLTTSDYIEIVSPVHDFSSDFKINDVYTASGGGDTVTVPSRLIVTRIA